MLKFLITWLLMFSFFSCSHDEMEIISPNGDIKVEFELRADENNNKSGQLYFRIKVSKDEVSMEILPFTPLGLVGKEDTFSDNLILTGITDANPVHDQYEMIRGKRRFCENFGKEKTFSLKNKEGMIMDVIFRVYNDGVAFRYAFPGDQIDTIQITEELTTYFIPEGTKRWVTPYSTAYEQFYPLNLDGTGVLMKGSSKKETQEWGYPALFHLSEHLFMLISEADVSDQNCASWLKNESDHERYKVQLARERSDYKKAGHTFTSFWKSPWRVLMVGDLANIVESTMITDLSTASKIKDTDWIKPGPVSWIYWAHNHGSKDYQLVTRYVDLAVEMGWPYVLIDWEWDVMSNGGDIQDAVKYANSHGIKPLMWYNSGVSWNGPNAPTPIDRLLTAKDREKEFTWLNSIGVYGIKVDFFAGDQQDMMSYYLDLLEDAASHELMVNFHGATTTRGWSRTYPNLMTVEAVYGAEWYNNAPVLTNRAAAHNTTLPFTRNVTGPMDYTPVTFSNSQHPHVTSFAHELALSVVFESGFQHFADRPSAYEDLPDYAKNFLKNVPVTWDDTKLLDGYPGGKVIMARRKEDQWYLGGLNGLDEVKILTVNFDFLEEGIHSLHLIKDGASDTIFAPDSLKVVHGDSLSISCLPRGGFVGRIKKLHD